MQPKWVFGFLVVSALAFYSLRRSESPNDTTRNHSETQLNADSPIQPELEPTPHAQSVERNAPLEMPTSDSTATDSTSTKVRTAYKDIFIGLDSTDYYYGDQDRDFVDKVARHSIEKHGRPYNAKLTKLIDFKKYMWISFEENENFKKIVNSSNDGTTKDLWFLRGSLVELRDFSLIPHETPLCIVTFNREVQTGKNRYRDIFPESAFKTNHGKFVNGVKFQNLSRKVSGYADFIDSIECVVRTENPEDTRFLLLNAVHLFATLGIPGHVGGKSTEPVPDLNSDK